MKVVSYYALRALIFLIVVIPYPLLLVVGNLFYFILFYIIGYRKTIVFQNLRHAFPSKSENEIKLIAKKYYVFLCDLSIETFKTMTLNKKNALRHCHLSDDAKALFDTYNKENKSIIVVMGHIGNWEWASSAFSLQCTQPLYVLYHPLSSYSFNRLMSALRTRFGTHLVPMRDTLKEMIKNKDIVSVTTFIADQTPPPETAYWTTFLNQDTGVFTGTEKIARRTNYPVIYACVKRIKRGYYVIEAETLFERPRDTAENEITEAHTRRLERDIIEQPETWLWSHRRWKNKRPVKTA